MTKVSDSVDGSLPDHFYVMAGDVEAHERDKCATVVMLGCDGGCNGNEENGGCDGIKARVTVVTLHTRRY